MGLAAGQGRREEGKGSGRLSMIANCSEDEKGAQGTIQMRKAYAEYGRVRDAIQQLSQVHEANHGHNRRGSRLTAAAVDVSPGRGSA